MASFTNNDKVKYTIIKRRPHKIYDADGLCDPPDYKNPKIHIAQDLPPRREMEVVLEEIMHAFFWDISEKEVRKFCSTATRILHQDGWRKEDKFFYKDS